ncbi:hypothetical protein Pla108_31980 [Botrimarina colliarenosi]|uniref:Uncharacterized protein n=1 Tax=Botrimarina colliarenosi TaxID=2528001 RepID=A0A5C6A9J7_9BACT|nr:hypothetical protein [Botrimarina colliarenosi]TWT96116.1 hypothetical protein Pla108_31980 [Botrimarina colliarenosi]
MRLSGLTIVAAMALLATGCAVAPHPQGPSNGSVTHDVVDYLHREWPLNGRPVVPADACQGSCSCCGGGAVRAHQNGYSATPATELPPEVWRDDWNQPGCLGHSRGYTDDPPPAVPLEAGGPGRFFPAPVKPVFAPQATSEVGFGPIVKSAR